MFANLLKKRHPTLLHIEYLVLRTCSEKCSKLKENKTKYFSKKYQGNVLVECLPSKREALNLISIVCKHVWWCTPVTPKQQEEEAGPSEVQGHSQQQS